MSWKFLVNKPYQREYWNWTEMPSIYRSNGFSTSFYYPQAYEFLSFISFLSFFSEKEIYVKKITFKTRFGVLIFEPNTLRNGFTVEDYVNLTDIPVEVEAIII